MLAGCSSDGRTLDPPIFPPPATVAPSTVPPATLPPEPMPDPLVLVTPWPDGAPVPERYTCEGENISPALAWSGVPDDTVELVVTVTDLDAPWYVHWVVSGIDPGVSGLAEGGTPAGAVSWTNGSGVLGYAGPCPPSDQTHRYEYSVHALNQPLSPADDMDAIEVIRMLDMMSIARSSVSGEFTGGG